MKDDQIDMQCRGRDGSSRFRRCTPSQAKEWRQEKLPMKYLLEDITGRRPIANAALPSMDAVWFEISLTRIGNGHDIPSEQLEKMPDTTIVNRFPGSAHAFNVKSTFSVTMQQCEADTSLLYPETIVLPTDASVIKQKIKRGSMWLAKPVYGGAGKGIELVRDASQAMGFNSPKLNYILQRFISRPMLISRHRFTIRTYAIVTSIKPLRVWIHKRGIVKFTTKPFEPMHASVTSAVVQQSQYHHGKGHSANKNAIRGKCDQCLGSRWKLSWLWKHLSKSSIDSDKVWNDIQSKLGVTMDCVLQSGLVKQRARSFQVLGVDFDLDSNGNAWLLEMNITPALGYQTEWEKLQKQVILEDIARLSGLYANKWSPGTNLEKVEEQHRGEFIRVR